MAPPETVNCHVSTLGASQETKPNPLDVPVPRVRVARAQPDPAPVSALRVRAAQPLHQPHLAEYSVQPEHPVQPDLELHEPRSPEEPAACPAELSHYPVGPKYLV